MREKRKSDVGNRVGNKDKKRRGSRQITENPFDVVAVPAGFEPAFSP
jgi:hypothetical protein